ncbi:MAG TPA: MtnX-like HAD-IB family phosphatase [Syntrophomonadaceae bacterium]|nr:MtnX-like HAD-IB family phosphatase [Syntrophomonadaceae bacterium]
MKKIFFIDFDGTITTLDSCTAMVEAFARDGWQEINQRWEQKELGTEDCANQTLALFDVSPEKLKDFLKNIAIDEFFPQFLQHCRKNGYPVYILSDGYDLNIQTILDEHQLQLPYYCNELIYTDCFQIRCPHKNDECGNCGTCKSSLMKRLKEKDSQTIYIGDGYSDICPASQADLVFAKEPLYSICQEKGIAAVPYQNFYDIIVIQGLA